VFFYVYIHYTLVKICRSLFIIGFNLSERFYGVLIMKFDRTASGDIRFDDFIQCCVVLQVIIGNPLMLALLDRIG
jgi:Ca2+-binding EF-hand superfamily protein